jgi:hypothetical protein
MRLLDAMRQHLLVAVMVLGMQCVLVMAMALAVDVPATGGPSATSRYTEFARPFLLDLATPVHLLQLCLAEAPLLIAALAYFQRRRRAGRARRRAGRAEMQTAYFALVRRSLPVAVPAPSPPDLEPPAGRPVPAVARPGKPGVVGGRRPKAAW